MTHEQLKEQIQQKLDEQNLIDLSMILQTPEGRRFLSWIFNYCQKDNYVYYGNSREYLEAGMRNVAFKLVGFCKYLGLSGLDLMHKAEKEYVTLQMDIMHELQKKEGEKNK